MNRRHFFKTAGIFTASAVFGSRIAFAAPPAFTPSPTNGWRLFEVSTRVELAKTESATRIWIPLPGIEDADWIRPIGNNWQGNAAKVTVERDPVLGTAMLAASWRF